LTILGSWSCGQRQGKKAEYDILFADHQRILPSCRYHLSVVCISLFGKAAAGGYYRLLPVVASGWFTDYVLLMGASKYETE
jgi:hypothetical protein